MTLFEILLMFLVLLGILMVVGFVMAIYCLICCVSVLTKEIETGLKHKPRRAIGKEQRDQVSPFGIDKIE